jgi:hypothetical protein
MQPYPAVGYPVGLFQPIDSSDFNTTRIDSVQSGPNAKIVYVSSFATLTTRYYVHPQLFSGNYFYQDQNGFNGTCLAGDVDLWVDRIRAHESATVGSHRGIMLTKLASHNPKIRFEKLIDVNRSKYWHSQTLYGEWEGWRGQYLDPDDAAFDVLDTPNVNNFGSCTMDFNPLNT